MPTMQDIFNGRPFRAVELTNAMNMLDPQPTLLGELGEDLFRTIRSRFRLIAVAKREGRNVLIPVSPIGAPPVELEKAGSEARYFTTRRLAKASTVYAEELQGVLQMPDYQAVTSVQQELADRGQMIRDDFELTQEHMRFGAVQGKVVDADGTTVLDNWFTNWGIAAPAAVNLHLNVETTNLRGIAQTIVDTISDNARGAWINGRTRVHALAGGDLYSALINHPNVEKTYLNYAAAAELRGEIPDTFEYGGITWHRWRGGTMDEFDIPTDEARFFPVGARDVFQRVFGPAEFEPWINTPGQDSYTIMIPDRDRNAWQRMEMYSYPLYMCLRPEMLLSAVMQ